MGTCLMDAMPNFSDKLLAWANISGRKELPWQQTHPYIVWLSEVMLQQTQVTTVIPYFTKFINQYPSVHDLAQADWDDVAQLWAGLGYYARARNLYATAKLLSSYVLQHQRFPNTLAEWVAFPGIGQSTAGAIMAMGCGEYGVILDGNVKRVLTRFFGIEDDITKSATTKLLWQKATDLTPKQYSGKYAQAIMDFGATLCTRKNPACDECPFQADCIALATNMVDSLPYKPKKQKKPQRKSIALLLEFKNKTLWLQRPNDGIWGGLWCLPLCDIAENKKPSITEEKLSVFNQFDTVLTKNNIPYLFTDDKQKSIKHTLTHFHWWLTYSSITLTEKEHENLCLFLSNNKIKHQWVHHTDFNALAKPKAMDKLLTKFVAIH